MLGMVTKDFYMALANSYIGLYVNKKNLFGTKIIE